MSINGLLKREIKALAFDQYGTIVDMQKGLTEAVTPFLQAKGWAGKPSSFVTWWRRTHFENSMIDALCDRGHTPYREIGHRAVSYVMDRCGLRYTDDDVRRDLESRGRDRLCDLDAGQVELTDRGHLLVVRLRRRLANSEDLLALGLALEFDGASAAFGAQDRLLALLLGHLDADLRGDQLGLLVRLGARVLGIDALLFRLLLLDEHLLLLEGDDAPRVNLHQFLRQDDLRDQHGHALDVVLLELLAGAGLGLRLLVGAVLHEVHGGR